jgi:hypothetical protein
MVRISTFMYCEGTQLVGPPNNQKLTVQNPQHVFNPMFIPGTFSFGIVFGVLGVDLKENHTLKVIFSSPDEEKVVDSEAINLPAQEVKNDTPDDFSGFMMNMDFRNAVLKAEGEYKTEIIFDGTSLGSYPIYVKRGESI